MKKVLQPEKASKVDKLIHNLNSHLAVIYGYVQLLEKKLEVDSQEKDWLEKVKRECVDMQESIAALKNAVKP